jgi:hypothetical protein
MRMVATATAVPRSNDEFVEIYRDYVVGLVRKLGVPSQEAEDVANNILLAELQAKNKAGETVGILALFNPEHTVTVKGRQQSTTFRAFLSARVALRVRGQSETLRRRAGRELLIADKAVDDTGTTWLDLFGPAASDDYSQVEDGEWLSRVRDHLARMPRPGAADSCDLLGLFDELVSEIRSEGRISALAVRRHLGISTPALTSGMQRLRSVMEGAASVPLPAPQSFDIGGVTLTAADIRSAIDVLHAADRPGPMGIMVKQPLARAGHPLAQAEAGWYHPFAKEEIRAFPEIAVDQQTHRKPAGHVKIAVLHRLERMLGLAGDNPRQPEEAAGSSEPSVAEPEPTPWDLIEAKIWAAGATDGAVVDEIRAMVEQYRREGVPAA